MFGLTGTGPTCICLANLDKDTTRASTMHQVLKLYKFHHPLKLLLCPAVQIFSMNWLFVPFHNRDTCVSHNPDRCATHLNHRL